MFSDKGEHVSCHTIYCNQDRFRFRVLNSISISSSLHSKAGGFLDRCKGVRDVSVLNYRTGSLRYHLIYVQHWPALSFCLSFRSINTQTKRSYCSVIGGLGEEWKQVRSSRATLSTLTQHDVCNIRLA